MSEKWRGECRGGGPGGGFATRGAEAGTLRESQQEAGTDGCGRQELEESAMTRDSWLQPRWALMRTGEKHVWGLQGQGGGFEASVEWPRRCWHHVFILVDKGRDLGCRVLSTVGRGCTAWGESAD